MRNPTDHYVILDRSDAYGPQWVLAVRVDRAGWRSASRQTLGAIPAELNEVGRPLPTEEGRIVLWCTREVADRPIVLRPLPGNGHVYRVHPVGEQEVDQ